MFPPVLPVRRIIRQSAECSAESVREKNTWIRHCVSACQNLRRKKKLTIRLVYCIIVSQCFEDIQDIKFQIRRIRKERKR